MKLLDSRQPIDALRKFLARISGEATREQGQIVLGSAQLMLLPIAHEHRGGDEVKQLLDLVLARWDAFPDRAGFHAQEFLRNAFAAVGDDPDRIAQLAVRVPADATSELRFNMAGAYAVCSDRPAMLRALEAALEAGATAAQVRRDPDLARFLDDPEVLALLDRAAVPAIPLDVEPHVAPVRAALDALVGALRELGEHSRLNPPATIEAVLAAERARKIQLPNDYRALLTLTDGLAAGGHEFLGTLDYRDDTPLARRAHAFLEMSASYGGIGMDECVPLASWGQPNSWLLYDPRGTVREGAPGYVVMLTADPWPMSDLAEALGRLEDSVRDALGTN
ncbi:MAG TPA: SMI1/KNR4 family protein [Kofleriaceae bacterium]|nr:SMI1/KNR4 family protein [Kofleriaceae bacterium]